MTSIARLDVDVTLADMRGAPSDDNQCLLVYCRDRVVALFCVMGNDVDVFEFGDDTRLSAVELLDRLAPVK